MSGIQYYVYRLLLRELRPKTVGNVVITHLFHPLLQYNARDPQLKHEPKASALLGRVLILQ